MDDGYSRLLVDGTPHCNISIRHTLGVILLTPKKNNNNIIYNIYIISDLDLESAFMNIFSKFISGDINTQRIF